MTILIVVCAILLVVCAAGAWYFLVVVPSRWRVPLRKATALLEREPSQRADLEAANDLLDEAMNAGPRGRELADVRFAHAFVRAMLGTYQPDHYWTASAIIDGNETDAATAYLALWLHNRLERHERAVELYEQHAEKLADRDDARRTAAASHLHLAGSHWRRRETDQAIHHFDRVRELGELVGEIPKAAANLHILKGIQSFFDGRFADAREAFETAHERATAQRQSTVEADLGLIACDWAAGKPAELDERLERLAIPPGGKDDSDATKEYHKQLNSVVQLLRLVVLVREWTQRPAKSGPLSDADIAQLCIRSRALRDVDTELGDPYLVEGLVRYYFALTNTTERETALAVLEEGMETAKAILVPEVLQLVEKERALGNQGDALSRFLRLVHEFLADPTISARHRDELLALRDQFTRYADDAAEDMVLPNRPASPYELQRRIDAVRSRIELIVYPHLRDLPEDAQARVVLRERLAELALVAESYTERADALHQSEHKLVMTTGEFLLPQEEWDDNHGP